jgi:hypothetical protein
VIAICHDHQSQVTNRKSQMEYEMSVLFNLLLFVGVFYLILQLPEPGDRRTTGARRAAADGQPGRKVA